MKTSLQLLAVACFFWNSMNLYAQEDYELLDFPQPGMVQGSVYIGSLLLGGGVEDISFGYDSDTLLCGNIYNKFWRIGQVNNEFYMRYDNGKIYYLLDCDDEFLMFDFSLEKGEIFETIAENFFISKTLVVDSVAIITIPNGEKRKWMKLESEEGFSETWIEGVGNVIYGFFQGFDIDGGYSRLVCQKDSSGLIFEAFDIEELEQDCDALTCPLVRVDFSFQTTGNSIQLTSQSQNEDAYEWTYGDGSPIDNNENPIHDFGIAGCYDICLKATSQCGRKDSLCQQVGVGFSEEWESIESGFDFNFFELGIRDAHFIDSDIVWMVSMTDVFKSVDGGENWNSVPHPNSEVGFRQFQSIHFYNDQFGIISALTTGITDEDIPMLNNVLITKNGGNTWESVHTDKGSYFTDAVWVSEEVAYVTGFSLWEISPENTTYLLMTNDGGDTWEHRQVSEGFGGGAIFAQNEFVVFVTGVNRLLDLGELAATYDGGENWVVLLNATDPLIHVFAIENDVWATTSMGEVYKSSNLGVSWTSIGHIGESPNDIYFTDSMQGWAVGKEGKMYATNDGGFTWELEYCSNSPLQNIHFPSMESIYIVTDEGILLTNSTITSIKENPITDQETIKAFPNPFTNHTSLQWITQQSKITCQVFDAYGRLVKTIEGENVESLKVDREGLVDGLYFYKVFGGKELLGSGKLMVVD